MGQLLIQVPSGQGETVLTIAKAHAGVNLLLLEANSDRGKIDAVTVHLDNSQIAF